MELREINAFLQVAQFKSFSKAARHLGYSQAAITIQIKQLEQELDVHLFDRIGKQISLTRDGELFFEHANTIMQELAQARETLSRDRKLHGTLRIGTIESICTVLLPQVMKQYHTLYPEVNVRITLDSPEILLNSLTNGTLDLVYILDQQIHDERFIKVLETPEEAVFTASSSNPFTGRQQIPLDEILSHPFILTERNASYRLMLDRYLAARERAIRPYLSIGNTEFIIRQLIGSSSLSFLPSFAIAPEEKKGLLCALDVDQFHMQVWRQVLHHKDKWVTREMEAFFQLLRS